MIWDYLFILLTRSANACLNSAFSCCPRPLIKVTIKCDFVFTSHSCTRAVFATDIIDLLSVDSPSFIVQSTPKKSW